MFSSPGMGEGEEGVAIAEGVAEVDVAEEHDVVVVAVTNKDDEPVEVIPLPDSPSPQLAYKQMTRIQIGPRGRPTGTIAQRMEVREASPVSSEIGSVAATNSKRTGHHRATTTVEQRPKHRTASTRSHRHKWTTISPKSHRGSNTPSFFPPRETKPPGSPPGGLGSASMALRTMGVGSGPVGSGVEGAAPASHSGETYRGGGDEVEKAMEVSRKKLRHKQVRRGRVSVKS
jgi:hypothetical protein